MVEFEEESDAYDMLWEYYIELEDPDMPESSKGQLFIVKKEKSMTRFYKVSN